MTTPAEDGAMESRARGHLHTGPAFSRSAKTSWSHSQAGLVEEVPSVCSFAHGRLLILSSLLQALFGFQVMGNLAAPRGHPCLLGVGGAKSRLQEGSGLEGDARR